MNEVKLIIWDLDDTLWQGTLAENDTVVLNQTVVEKIKFLITRGVMHSICSKNDMAKAEKMLKEFGIYDLFIFPMISFEDKGSRVKTIIKKAQLREQNVLFVDDNDFVLREITFHNPNIMTKLINDFLQEDITKWGKDDSKCERLAQYKILEEKEKNKAIFFEKSHDEQDFLKECEINIELIPLTMEDNDIERVIELVNRSNQLNFTKSRIQYEYQLALYELKRGVNFKIHVQDKYGDYGIGGYVCILKNHLLHFVFSCRLLGMCVEARVYQWIQAQYPGVTQSFSSSELKQVDSDLEFITIDLKSSTKTKKPINADKRILLRGPCIMSAISFPLHQSYHVDEEVFYFFNYANLHFLRKYLTSEKGDRLEKTKDSINNNDYNTIVNFLESDYYSGLYTIRGLLTPVSSGYIFWKSLLEMQQENPALSKEYETMVIERVTNQSFNLGDRYTPLPPWVEKIIHGAFSWFSSRYWKKILYKISMYFMFKNYQGFVSEEQFSKNLDWYIALFPESTQLIFISPPEKVRVSLLNDSQHQIITARTKTLNGIMRSIAQRKSNVVLLEMDNIIEQEDMVDSFSHLKRSGYIKLAQALLKAVDDWNTPSKKPDMADALLKE